MVWQMHKNVVRILFLLREINFPLCVREPELCVSHLRLHRAMCPDGRS